MTLSSDTLARLKRFQADTMDDLCNIYHTTFASGTYSTHGTSIRTGTFNISCGIEFVGRLVKPMEQTSQQSEQIGLIDYDVVLRVPSTQTIFMSDEIELIEKGVTTISGTFKPVDAPKTSSSAQKVMLKRVLT